MYVLARNSPRPGARARGAVRWGSGLGRRRTGGGGEARRERGVRDIADWAHDQPVTQPLVTSAYAGEPVGQR